MIGETGHENLNSESTKNKRTTPGEPTTQERIRGISSSPDMKYLFLKYIYSCYEIKNSTKTFF